MVLIDVFAWSVKLVIDVKQRYPVSRFVPTEIRLSDITNFTVRFIDTINVDKYLGILFYKMIHPHNWSFSLLFSEIKTDDPPYWWTRKPRHISHVSNLSVS